MESLNEGEVPSPPELASLDSEQTERARAQGRWDGGGTGGASTGKTTDSSVGSYVVTAHEDDDDLSSLSMSSDKSTTANKATNRAAATNPVYEAPLAIAVGERPIADGAAGSNRKVETEPGFASSQASTRVEQVVKNFSDEPAADRKIRVLDLDAAREVPSIPAVLAPKPRRTNTASPACGRFGRAHKAVTEETNAEARRRFWNGVKPAGTNSMLMLPPGKGASGLSMGPLRAAMKFKKKANVIQAKSIMTKFIVDPRSPRMQLWKNWMLVNIMFTVLVTPWRISFQCPARAFGLVLAGIVNISFIVDTVLHFFTAVVTESGLLTERREIARRYVTSWFFLDLVTSVPYTTLLRNVIPSSLRVMAPMRGLRLLKLLKVVKVYAMHYEVSPVAMSIGKTLVTVILAAHLLSCFWFWVHCYDALQEGEPKEWKQCGLPTSVGSQYLSSFYFIIYTMMTVGYGDQHADPSSNKALVLSVCIQLTGATLFGFIIAATRRIVQFIAPIQKVTTNNLQKISEYALDRRLPDGVSSRIKRHFRYFYFKTSVFDEREVMKHVPWQLCQEVMSTTHGVAISATGLLQDNEFSPIALMRLARVMKPMELDSGEQAVLQGDVVLQAYFVIKGRVEAYIHEEQSAANNDNSRSGSRTSFADGGGSADVPPPLRQSSYLGVWGPSSMWGLSNIMLGGNSEATFVAASPSDLLWLDQSDLVAAIDEHPEIRACLEKTATTAKNALREALESTTITKEGLKLKQISLTDFKASDLKQQLKHTDIRNLCMAASADQLAAATAKQTGPGSAGGMVGMVQDFQQMAAFGGRGVRGRLKSIVGSVKVVLRGRRIQKRLVRTWRAGSYGFGEVLDGMGKVVGGVTETEETPEELNHRLIMLPDQPIKLRWDVAISLVCVLVAMLTPYRMAFAHNDAKSWLVFDAAVDVLFVVDILLRFRTAYVGNAANNVIVYITVPGMILKNYLRGWMLLDIASTIPGYLFGTSDKVFRGLIVLKLLRIGRVPALAQQLHRLREQEAMANSGARRRSWLRFGMSFDVPRWCLDVVQILVVILYASHIFGCLWWVMSRYDEGESWWQRDGLDIDDATSTYIASLYWAATTITTVGYGDLVPTSDLERMIACITMLCGTTMFSYVIGSVSTLVMNPTGGNVRRNLELMNVENYLEEQKVGDHLGNSVRTHMVFVTGARSAWNEDHIISRLPPRLQERVLEHVHRDAVLMIPILKTKPRSFVAAILRNLRPRQYSQGEVVYKNLQMSQGVYFVTKGIAEAYVKVGGNAQSGTAGVGEEDKEEEEKVKGIISTGKLFGYTKFLAAFLEEDMAVKAFTQLYVYLLSNTSIRYLLQYHPFLAEELRVSLEEAVFQQASEEIAAEKKKMAARKALYNDCGSDGKPNPGPDGTAAPGSSTKARGRRTSALANYLRTESMSVRRSSLTEGAQEGDVQGGNAHKGKQAARVRIHQPDKDIGRKREVGDGREDKGEAGRQKYGTASRAKGKATRRSAPPSCGGVEDDEGFSDEESTTIPGLSGLLVTQLTWGAGNDAWDAALAVAEEEEAVAAAVAAAAAIDQRKGVVGTTRTAAIVPLGEVADADHKQHSGLVATFTGTPGGDAGAQQLHRNSAQALAERGDSWDEGGSGGGSGGGGGERRATFTERLPPLRDSTSDAGSLRRKEEEDARHIPPALVLPEDRDKSREGWPSSQGQSKEGKGDEAQR